jgi:hypothetical protein
MISVDFNYLSNRIVGNGYSLNAIPTAGIPLSVFMSLNGIRCVNLLKMNIEGSEIQALEGLRDQLKHVRNLVISCHDFKAAEKQGESYRTFDRVSEILRSEGFNLTVRAADPRREVPYYIYGENANAARIGFNQ